MMRLNLSAHLLNSIKKLVVSWLTKTVLFPINFNRTRIQIQYTLIIDFYISKFYFIQFYKNLLQYGNNIYLILENDTYKQIW